MKTKRILIFSIFICFFTCVSKAQLLDSLGIDTMRGYISLKEAAAVQPGQVIKLVLEKNKFKEFPEEIKQYTNLQYLDLSKNPIKEVPSWIGNFTNLQILVLSRTKIDSFPPEFGSLIYLKYLIMNRCELRKLPHQIGNLKELKGLDLWDDNLSYYPPELKDISGNLESLDLRDVLVDPRQQEFLKSELPTTTIYFSPACPCEK